MSLADIMASCLRLWELVLPNVLTENSLKIQLVNVYLNALLSPLDSLPTLLQRTVSWNVLVTYSEIQQQTPVCCLIAVQAALSQITLQIFVLDYVQQTKVLLETLALKNVYGSVLRELLLTLQPDYVPHLVMWLPHFIKILQLKPVSKFAPQPLIFTQI
jgi:hypothetical protein